MFQRSCCNSYSPYNYSLSHPSKQSQTTIFGNSSSCLQDIIGNEKKSFASIFEGLGQLQMQDSSFSRSWARLQDIVSPHVGFRGHIPYPITSQGQLITKNEIFIQHWLQIMKKCTFVCWSILQKQFGRKSKPANPPPISTSNASSMQQQEAVESQQYQSMEQETISYICQMRNNEKIEKIKRNNIGMEDDSTSVESICRYAGL